MLFQPSVMQISLHVCIHTDNNLSYLLILSLNPDTFPPVLASKSPDTASNGAEMQNRRRRRNTWESLDQCNEQFIKVLVKRKAMPHTDFIMQNIVSVASVSVLQETI